MCYNCYKLGQFVLPYLPITIQRFILFPLYAHGLLSLATSRCAQQLVKQLVQTMYIQDKDCLPQLCVTVSLATVVTHQVFLGNPLTMLLQWIPESSAAITFVTQRHPIIQSTLLHQNHQQMKRSGVYSTFQYIPTFNTSNSILQSEKPAFLPST